MPEEDFNKIASQADNDTKQVEEGLKGWKTMTGDAIARRTQPTRDFRKAFEDSVWREWVAVKKELEKSLLGASSQDRLVSTQITNQLLFNSCFRANSPAGWSIDATLIPISTN